MMSDNPEETIYYLRIISMYLDLGTELLLEVFKKLIPGNDVSAFLRNPALIQQLQKLFNTKVLYKHEFNLVLNLNVKEFDISLLIKLIIEFLKPHLQKPQLGWDKPPGSKDFSEGADILRLRRIRNELIGHRPNAKLSEQYYEQLLKQIKVVFGRLASNVVPHFKAHLDDKIKSYEETKLEYNFDPVQKHLQEIQTWFDELKTNLQEKVEVLVKKSKEFELYFKRKPVKYGRFIGLLFEGGRLVLSEILLRELRNAGKDLHCIVNDNSHLFGEIHELSQDPCSWDISILESLIFEVADSNLRTADKKKIHSIGDARKNYAETALASLDETNFFAVWTELVCNLTALSGSLSDDVVEQSERLIEKYMSVSDEVLDTDSYLDQLKASGVQIKSLQDVYKETVDNLREPFQQMIESGIKLNTDGVIDLKLDVVCENEEDKRAAEDDLETVFTASLLHLNSPPELENIRLEVDRVLKRVSRIPDTKVKECKRNCILMSVQCSSFAGVLGLINLMQDEEFQQHLTNLSILMSIAYDQPCVILENISIEDLIRVKTNSPVGQDASEPAFILPIIYSSAKGMKDAYELLSCEDTTNLFNKMAETLTQQRGNTIEVKTSPDLHELSGVFENSDSTKSESSGCSTDDDIDNKFLPQTAGMLMSQRSDVTVTAENPTQAMADTAPTGERVGFRGSFGSGGRGRGMGKSRQRGRVRGRKQSDAHKEWMPVTKLGRLVKDMKIKSLEEIYRFSLPIKEFQIIDYFLGPSLNDEVLKIIPVQKQTGAGQTTRFKTFVAIGDHNGHVGLGVKCSREVTTSIRGAIILAKLSVISVRRGYWGNQIGQPHTVPCKVTGKCGSVRVRLIPAPCGTGIVSAPVPKKLLHMAGIEDCYTSTKGCTGNLGNFAKATYAAIAQTYKYLTPDLWEETIFTQSPYQEFTDYLSKNHIRAELQRQEQKDY